MKQPITITLPEPHEFEGKTITELTMQPPKAKDQLTAEGFGKNNAEKEIWLLSILCSQPYECIADMDICNYLKLQEVYRDFLFATAISDIKKS